MTKLSDRLEALHPQTVKDAIAQIEKCGFECEAGPLANNVGWQWLKACLEVGPEFWPGQSVWFSVEAIAAGKTLTQWVRFFVVGCRMDADTEQRYWVYDLSYDPPAPWHYGETHFRNIRGSKLFIDKPDAPPPSCKP